MVTQQAVVLIDSNQYNVSVGENILVHQLIAEPGEIIEFDKVLLYSDGEKSEIGTPYVSNAKIIAEVISRKRGPKVIVFKKRSKKGYKKTQGHRQYFTELKIKEIKVA